MLLLASALMASVAPPAAASSAGDAPAGCATLIADFVPSLHGFYCSAGEVGSGPEADVVKTWTAPTAADGVTFLLFGGDDPGSARGGMVQATLPVTAGETLTLSLGTEGRATLVSREGAPLLVAGGGDGSTPNYVAPGSEAVEVEAPGGSLGPYPANGRMYGRWGTLQGDPPPEATCVVPDVTGRRPKPARRLLVQADCTVGSVRRRGAGSWRHYRVRRQWPRPGVWLPAGAPVSLLLVREA